MSHLDPILDSRHSEIATSERGLAVRSLLTAMRRAARASYDPHPLEIPQVDPDLPELPAVPRITEVLRYSIAKLEYSLSSGGHLRAWLKLNLLVSVVMAIPVLLVLPPLTWALGTFATWSAYISTTAINVFWATLAIVGTAGIGTCTLFVIRRLLNSSRR